MQHPFRGALAVERREEAIVSILPSTKGDAGGVRQEDDDDEGRN